MKKPKLSVWESCYDKQLKGFIVPEAWKPVVGMESYYEVSNHGRVRTHHRIGRLAGGGVMSLQPNAKGYMRVRLSAPGVPTFSVVVNRLVLEAFVGPRPSPIHESNHKDGQHGHNFVGNLEWVTPVQNNAHSVANGLWHPHLGEDHGRAKIRESDVRRIRSLEGVKTRRQLAGEYGVTPAAIGHIWKRVNWKHVT